MVTEVFIAAVAVKHPQLRAGVDYYFGLVDGEHSLALWPAELAQPTTAELLAAETAQQGQRIAARRYQAEVGGITVGGLPVDTDDRSKLLINGAAVEAMLDPAYVLRWKAGGEFVDLTAEEVIGVARGVRAHVQACFDREAVLLAELAAGTFTENMLDEGWPNG
jgi:hypothetical protein